VVLGLTGDFWAENAKNKSEAGQWQSNQWFLACCVAGCSSQDAGTSGFAFVSKKVTTKTNAKANAREREDDPGLFDDEG
jgi:hypothetical protein